MRIAIGTKNPVKIRACERVMKRIYGNNVELIPVEVNSKVSHTPLSDEEMITGARNRALYALRKTRADLGIGMEGGISEISKKHFLAGWAVIIDKNGKESIGGGQRVELPSYVVKEVKEGKELGNIIDEIANEQNTKQKYGAIGIFTDRIIDREKAWEITLIFAMSKFLRPDLYEKV
jgi:inosine/xanthosine triphosphatase